MIPKKLHYCWFGRGKHSLEMKRCLASWRYHMPDYEQVCWSEENFDVTQHPFTAAAYASGRYAFVSDYVRMHVLGEHGGIYLDIDVEVKARFDSCLSYNLFIGLEDYRRFATSVIGACAGHWLPQAMLHYYNLHSFDLNNLSALVNVNEVSRLLLEKGFSGEGGSEQIGNERVFEIGVFASSRNQAPKVRPIARHLYAGSWRAPKNKKSLASKAYRKLRKLPNQLEDFIFLNIYKIKIIMQKKE
ncbi:glycosyltransferase family 32 protein [Pseudomonas sp. JZ134]|uniref:glycosyltransferase family 32 protein n=1 Tax=Pseudomonas sp. JZ134 TaxID=2806615 RepID=UPI003DA017FE